jgi:hypothetical protein
MPNVPEPEPVPVRLRKVPRGTFLVGGLIAVALGLPLVSVALLGLARVAGIGDPESPLDRIALLSAIFAGFPAFLSGGGVARLAAHRLAEVRFAGGAVPPLSRALVIAALAMGAAGIGIAVLTAVPIGGMPEEPPLWAIVAAAGLVAGAITGVAIGLLVGMRQRRYLARVGP